MDEDRGRMEIATFRFGVIADFVTGTRLDYGEKERLLREKSRRSYKIPLSNRTSVSKSSILQWINEYKKAGYRIEGLTPTPRKDKGTFKTLTPTIRMAIKELKKENPHMTVPMIIKKLRQMKIIPMEEYISESRIYKFLKQEKLNKINTDAVDKRSFEAESPNELWQSDVMHGPQVKFKGINRKAYLCAIIDDFSRLIVNAQFYPNEGLLNLKDCLKQAIEKRGIPQKLYVDNGACYRALNLEQVSACLGIALKHSRPYTPQGRGKIERWFRTVRDQFLPLVNGVKTLDELNEMLKDWVDGYNGTIHGTIKCTPQDRFRKNLECVRPAPKDLIDYFRMVDFRKVRKDRTFQLRNKLFEAPVSLIDKKIELRYHEENPEEVEVFFNNQSFGAAGILDKNINSKIGRDYKSALPPRKIESQLEDHTVITGKLFEGGDPDEQV